MTRSPASCRAALAGSCLVLLALAGCDDASDFDVSTQIGPDPVLPEPSFSLLPDLKIAEVAGWQEGETPSVPEGLSVTAYAADLVNPRTVHTLPNGDVLVVQSRAPGGKPTNRPKDYIRGWIMSMAKGGGGGPQEDSNLITLLRDTDRDGVVDERTDLLTGLNSPFGVAWVDGTLYVAAADAILAWGQRTLFDPEEFTGLSTLEGLQAWALGQRTAGARICARVATRSFASYTYPCASAIAIATSACAARVIASSPLAASCSSAYSRTVSSMSRRASGLEPRRLRGGGRLRGRRLRSYQVRLQSAGEQGKAARHDQRCAAHRCSPRWRRLVIRFVRLEVGRGFAIQASRGAGTRPGMVTVHRGAAAATLHRIQSR